MRNSFTGPSTQVQPQHPTLEQQLSVLVSVQAERDEEFVDIQARLRDTQAQLDELLLSRDQQIGQYERKLEAVCLRLADAEKGLTLLDKLVVSHDQQVTDMSAKLEAKESELGAVRLRLTDAEKGLTLLDKSHDQLVTDMSAKLEAKESELEAVRLRLTDAEKALTKSKAEADTLRAQKITDSRNRDEDQVTRELMERMQAIEDEVARGSKRWSEKSIEEMVCRNER
jgi:chromosome segregation ATPase